MANRHGLSEVGARGSRAHDVQVRRRDARGQRADPSTGVDLPPRLVRRGPLEAPADPELGALLRFVESRARTQRLRLAVGAQPPREPPATTQTSAVEPHLVEAPATTMVTEAKSTRAITGAPGEILSRTDASPALMVLRAVRAPDLRFAPGQYVKVGFGGVTRSYSLASTPEDAEIELCIERVAGGALTSKLFALAPGARLEIARSAKGALLFDASARAHLMISTVTGVAPFMSMVRSVVPRSPNARILLIQGARHPEDVVYRAELEQFASRFPGFEYWPAVTQPTSSWSGRTGRVTLHVDDALARLGLPCTAYACGNPDMVREVASRMKALAIDVRTEAYWS